jgi:hypothetical protein
MSRLATVARRALALACIATSTTSAQQVRQQSMPPAFDVDSAMARAATLRRQNRKAEAERVMAKAVAAAPARADARALHDLLVHEVRRGASSCPSGARERRRCARTPAPVRSWRAGRASSAGC